MKRRDRALAFVLAGLLLAVPALAADGAPDVSKPDWGKVLDYTMCGIGVAGAATGGGVVFALLACGKVAIKYWN